MTIKKTLAQLLAEDPDLEYRLKSEGKWHKVTPAWAWGSIHTGAEDLRDGRIEKGALPEAEGRE